MPKKFKFRLQAVLRYREILKDSQEARLMQASKSYNETQQAISVLDDKQDQVYQGMVESAQQGFSLVDHLSKETFNKMITYEKSKEKARLAKRLKAVQFEQKRFIDYAKKFKTMEKLQSKAFELYQKDVQDEENKLLDDLVNNRHRAQE